MRAVVDTNILVPGLLHREGAPRRVLQAIAQRRIVPVVSAAVIDEYRAALPRPRLRLRPVDIQAALSSIERMAEWVTVPPYDGHPPLPDTADWPIVACALATGCPVITGNVRHFPVGPALRVMTAREWLDAAAD